MARRTRAGSSAARSSQTNQLPRTYRTVVSPIAERGPMRNGVSRSTSPLIRRIARTSDRESIRSTASEAAARSMTARSGTADATSAATRLSTAAAVKTVGVAVSRWSASLALIDPDPVSLP